MAQMETAAAWARERQAPHLEQYTAFLNLPSVSTLPEHQPDIERTAEWLAEELRRIGMAQVDILPTPGHPMVFAEVQAADAGAPTVLVYGHYDVQPADPLDEWDTPPFDAQVRGDYMYARGASDMKGQVFAVVKAVEALLQAGPPPLNIKFMIEGEEEVGSPNLQPWIEANRDRLKCDVALNCDTSIYSQDQPSITTALRGLCYYELMIEAAEKDMHSGMFGGAVFNPLHVLGEIVAGLHDEQARVMLPGFYDDVRPLTDAERADLAKLPYDDGAFMDEAGTWALHGEAGYQPASAALPPGLED